MRKIKPPDDRLHMWYPQNGATQFLECDTTNYCITSKQLTSCYGAVHWPPRSRNFTALDYCGTMAVKILACTAGELSMRKIKPTDDYLHMWQQQDGATQFLECDTTNYCITAKQLISCYGAVNWLPRSRNFITLDQCVTMEVKILVCIPNELSMRKIKSPDDRLHMWYPQDGATQFDFDKQFMLWSSSLATKIKKFCHSRLVCYCGS